MNKIYIYIVLFVFAFAACKTEKVKVDDGKFKKDDAVFLSMTKEYSLAVDGSQEYVYRQKLRLQSQASFNSMYGDSHVFYDPDFQECEVLLAETDNSMGVAISGDNAINDILPSNAKRSAYYNRLREKVVSHLGTEIGAVVKFDYKIKSKKDWKPALFERIVIPASSPIRDCKIVVKLPKTQDLSFHLFNSSVEPVVIQKEDFKIYTWTFKDLPAVEHQYAEPSYREDVPCLVFTTASGSSLEHFMSSNKLTVSDSSFFKPVVESIKKSLKRNDKLFLKLQETVINDIDFNHISFSAASFRGRAPKDVWTEASGNIVEKCFLLKELLNAAGYESEVLTACPRSMFSYSKLNPELWTNWYVSVKMGNESFLLSAVKKNTYDSSIDAEGFCLYSPLTGKEYEFSSFKNLIKLEGTINMFSRKNVKARLNLVLEGKFAHEFKDERFLKSKIRNCYRMLPKKDTSRLCMLADTVNNISVEAKLFSYKMPNYRGGFSIKNLPVLLADRKIPLDIKNTVDESYDFTLRVGKWYRSLDKDTTISIGNSVGEVLVSIKTILKDRYIVSYKRELKLNKRIISVEDYPKFKELIDVWSDDKYKSLFFTFRKHVPKKKRVVRDSSMMRGVSSKSLGTTIKIDKLGV